MLAESPIHVPGQDDDIPREITSRSLAALPPTDAGQLADTTTRHSPESVSLSEIDAAWTPYFSYDSIYADQRTAIDSLLDILAENGYYLKEGACGTGKTLAAVTASVYAMRDPDELSERAGSGNSFPTYERTLVVTPVKQQLRQFIGELRGMNRNLPDGVDPIATVVLRGQSDMMAVKNAELPDTDDRDDIQDLRDITRDIIDFDSDIPLRWPDDIDPPAYSRFDYDWSNPSKDAKQAETMYRYDPYRAQAVRDIVKKLTPDNGSIYERLEIAGIKTPYPAHVPHTRDIVDVDRLRMSRSNQLPADQQGRFDPFYAATFSKHAGGLTDFDDAPHYVVDRETIFSKAISQGRCPHELMGMLAEQADLVLGNYNHLLDPETRYLTDGKLSLLDDETIVVVDEAHQLEERSRDRLSTSVDLYTLDKARNDVELARHYATGNFSETPTPALNQTDSETAQEIARDELYLEVEGVSLEDLIAVEQLLELARETLIDACETIDGLRFPETQSSQTLSRPMASINNPDWGDHLTRAVEDHESISMAVFSTAERVMNRIEPVFESLEEAGIVDRTPQGRSIGAFFRQWAETQREVYHPEARVIASEKESFPDKYPAWVEHYTPELRLFNCIPQRELRRVFGELGGGVLMSATLHPIEPYQEATGIDDVPYAEGIDETIDEEDEATIRANGITDEMVADLDTRPTTFERFPLRFAPENRLSLVADLPRFTQSNRGSPTADDGRYIVEKAGMTPTRREYADLIDQVAHTRGNILIAMPSYEEAQWAYEYVQSLSVDKRCLVDASSTAAETDELLEEFFADGAAILCTSLLGTITEGVDFVGDKVHTCLNIGVPLPPSDSHAEAVEVAYQQAIDSTTGRDAAQRIPATRKVRQSIGRVIRGAGETGVRIVADERYGTDEAVNLRYLLSAQQRREFTLIEPGDVQSAVTRFWEQH